MRNKIWIYNQVLIVDGKAYYFTTWLTEEMAAWRDLG